MRPSIELTDPPSPAPPPRSRRRWWWLGAAAVVVGAIAVFLFATESGLRSALPKKPRTWLVVVGIGLGWLLVAWFVIRPLVKNVAVRTLLIAVPPVAFSVWALAPAFFDKTVNEDFPVAAGAPITTAVTPAVTVPVTVPSAVSSVPASAAPTVATIPTTTAPATTAAPAGPVRLATGMFSGLAGHEGTGDAVLYRLPDGTNLVRLENLDLQNGPDLVVYLVPQAGQTELDGAVSLGDLKGNKGNQNYPVPADVDPAQYGGVLVWCRAFSVEFAGAPFAAV